MPDRNVTAPTVPPARGRSRWPLIVMAAVAIAPVVAAAIAYFFFPRDARTNYGELLAVGPIPEIAGARLDGTPFRISELKGKWVLLHVAPGGCAEACQRELYATRQARTIQGRERERVQRVWLIADESTPSHELLEQHPELLVARVREESVRVLPAGGQAIYLVDPLGNLVLRYPEDPDIKRLSKDLGRLLRASSIG